MTTASALHAWTPVRAGTLTEGWRADVRDGLLLAGIVGVLTAVNLLWFSTDTLPPQWDQASHMMSAFRYHDTLATCYSADRGVLKSVVHCARMLTYVDMWLYAPLYGFAGGLVTFIGGNSIPALAMTNVPFLVLLVCSVYGLGRRMHSRAAGVLAAMLVCAYPIVFIASREFMLEIALMSLTAASALLLVLSNRFEDRRFTILFGITAGLALLTKATYLPFIAGLCLFEAGGLALDVWRGRVSAAEGRRRAQWMAAGAVIAIGLAALWYVPNRANFTRGFTDTLGADATRAGRLSFTALSFYAEAMARDQMGLPLFGLFLFGLFRLGHLPARSRWLLLVWVGSIYAICTVPLFKLPHNTVGILIPAAILSAAAVAGLAQAPRRIAIGAVTAFACLQLALFSLPGREIVTFGYRGAIEAPPRSEDWPIERTLVAMADAPARILVVSDHQYVNGTTAQFYAAQHRLPLEIRPCWAVPTHAGADFSAFDYLIAKSDTAWATPSFDGCFHNSTGHQDYAALLATLERRFSLARSVPLPDGSSLLVYRVTVPIAQAARIE